MTKNDDIIELVHEEKKQNILSQQLLQLSSSLKQNFITAGSVLKEDNAALDHMHKIATNNKQNLIRESGRLGRHAYKYCFDVMMFFLVIFVLWTFISMIILMRVFPKV